jgi:hypothetical protein
MNHPFELELTELEVMDLDFKEQLTQEETATIEGGKHSDIVCISAPCPGSETGGDNPDYPVPTKPKPPKVRHPRKDFPDRHPPEFTTLALGEEGGGYYPI